MVILQRKLLFEGSRGGPTFQGGPTFSRGGGGGGGGPNANFYRCQIINLSCCQLCRADPTRLVLVQDRPTRLTVELHKRAFK